jgi:hypothetical protein
MTTPEQDQWVRELIGFDFEAAPDRSASLGGDAHDELTAPVDKIMADFVNASADTTAPQPIPLSQKQTIPQPAPPQQKKPPTPVPAPAKPQPIVYTRTAQIDKSDKTTGKINCRLPGPKRPRRLKKILEGPGGKGLSAKKLGEISRILKEASMTNSVPDAMVPAEDETNKIRENYANLNAAIASGKFDDAGRLGLDLGLPITDEEIAAAKNDPKSLSDKKWKTLLALGSRQNQTPQKRWKAEKPTSSGILILTWA